MTVPATAYSDPAFTAANADGLNRGTEATAINTATPIARSLFLKPFLVADEKARPDFMFMLALLIPHLLCVMLSV